MERAKLLKALKTRIEFFSELGVDGIRATAQEEEAAAIAPSAKEAPSSEINDLVSSLKQRERPSVNPTAKASEGTPDRDILGSTRISEVRKRKPRKTEYPRQEMAIQTSDSKKMEASNEVGQGELPDSNETIEEIRTEIGAECERCQLCEQRTQVVNSIGNEGADLMVIGEAPGADEDLRGEPFVGRAGKLLTKILEAIEFERKDVFIGNINRCRPPKNRQPTLEESAMCKPFLLREIAVVRPKVIVVLGNTATKNLLDTKTGITKLRGKFHEFMGVKVMPTFHPAYLLRDPRKKREVWEDMKKVRDFINTGNE